MFIKKSLASSLLGLVVLTFGAIANTASAMGPPSPQDIKSTTAVRGDTTDDQADMNDIIRSLPGGK